MNKYSLMINGVDMPTPVVDGVQITEEKIWSANTGRVSSGKMVGSVIAVKRTITITWPTLTAAQAKKIREVVSDKDHPFVPIKFTDTDGTVTTMTVYFGTPTFVIHRLRGGVPVITEATVEGIEQ